MSKKDRVSSGSFSLPWRRAWLFYDRFPLLNFSPRHQTSKPSKTKSLTRQSRRQKNPKRKNHHLLIKQCSQHLVQHNNSSYCFPKRLCRRNPSKQFLVSIRHALGRMITRRHQYIYALLKLLFLGTIRWRNIENAFDIDTSILHASALALKMPPKRNQGSANRTTANIQSVCDCGKMAIEVSIGQNDSMVGAINCHCTNCRRYHTGPYTSFLKTNISQVSIRRGKKKIGKYLSHCNELGPVERWFCVDCSSKMLSVPQSQSSSDIDADKKGISNRDDKLSDGTANVHQSKEECNIDANCFVNLGPVVEQRIPPTITDFWKEELTKEENNIHFDERKGVWVRATCLEESSDDEDDSNSVFPAVTWSGGCSCGACRYDFTLDYPTELQHCYCNLCRKLSGSPFMSWIPVEKDDFRWKPSSSLKIVRTTPFGRRHICTNCKSVMTILYDEQPDAVWPCAGSLDDSSLPSDTAEISKYFGRVCHICCRYHPTWLEVRDDGLDRIEEAS